MITRHLIEINGQYWHFRKAGTGPLVFLLHASPRNSAMFIPLIEKLSQNFTVVAPDTPGYGMSDGILPVPATLAEYLPYFKAFFEYFKNDFNQKFGLYGTATGAQLGIAYAYTYPEDVAHLFLDNAAHFTDEERNKILESYFPDLSPKADGSHLSKVWQMSSQFFNYFPWFMKDEAHQVSANQPPVNMINTSAMEFLQAGEHYDSAYRAAFEHEKAENLAKVKVPTTLFRWKGAILLKYIDDLIAIGLEKNVEVIETEAPIQARYEAIFERTKSILSFSGSH